MPLPCPFFGMFQKAELAQRLPAALRDAIALITLEDGKTYTIQTSGRLEKLPYREIYFIERDGKKCPHHHGRRGVQGSEKPAAGLRGAGGRRSFSTSTGAVS